MDEQTSDLYKNLESDLYKNLEEVYNAARSVRHGRPDLFQFHQNELCHAIAQFILCPYWSAQQRNEEPSDIP